MEENVMEEETIEYIEEPEQPDGPLDIVDSHVIVDNLGSLESILSEMQEDIAILESAQAKQTEPLFYRAVNDLNTTDSLLLIILLILLISSVYNFVSKNIEWKDM